MIIKHVEKDKQMDECPHCGHTLGVRQIAMKYCDRCYHSLEEEVDENGDRKLRFHVL